MPQQPRLLLAADVGGTKTLLQLRQHDSDGQITPIAEERYPSGEFDSLETMLEHFLHNHSRHTPDSACLAVAGPITQHPERQTARLTNLPWELDSRRIGQALGTRRIALLNDFQAIGYSLDALSPDELAPLHTATATADAPKLVIGAGTGLGVCTLFPDNGRHTSYPSEGGHLAFAPRGAQQQRLLQMLERELGRVSWERLVSGAGLVRLYRFILQEADAAADDPLLRQPDPAAAIGERAVVGDHPHASEAVALFSSLYGAFTGDLALNILPAGGIYIAGGIAPKLLTCLQDGHFTAAYFDKGRMSELLRRYPVQVITNPQSGLLGAAHYAARL